MRRPTLILSTTLCFALLLAAAMAWASWSSGAAPYRLDAAALARPLPCRFRDGDEHDACRVAVPGPYVLELAHGNGSLLYYGAHHTSDPASPQVADIETRWSEFRPTIALCEGRSRGYLTGWLGRLLQGLPEPALVHELARRDGVPLVSLEPEYEDEVALLLRQWSPEQVALYFTMRVYWSEAGGKADEALAEDLVRKRTAVRGLLGTMASAADIDRVWAKSLAAHGDWRTHTSMPEGTFLEEIDLASRVVRGEHMARVLVELVGRGERVFAVVGSGHVIRQEWTLRAMLGAASANDQPPDACGTPIAEERDPAR
ncbi:MAG: hypothetical protein NDJ92_15735 [Thermoanaerobaculia bacterium]|nr:hypothetical protein [Thermoanaerobaculia bacterium]